MWQDRESEPRFTGPPAARGGYEGGAGGGGRGGYGGGAGGGAGFGGPPPSNGRQIFVNNVCSSSMQCIFQADVNDVLATIYCWLAGPEGSLSSGW